MALCILVSSTSILGADMSVKITRSGIELSQLALFDGNPTLVAGVLKGATNNEEGSGEKSVAKYAMYQEYGTSTTPARPFLRNAIEKNQDEWIRQIARGIKAGHPVRQVLETVRNVVRADIVNSIKSSGDYAPLAPSTVKAKERKGRAQPNSPLIDSATLIRSIQTEIRE